MQYYHIFLEYKNIKGLKTGYRFNLSKTKLKNTFAKSYNLGKTFWFVDSTVHPSNVKRAFIIVSDIAFKNLILPNGKKILKEKNFNYITHSLCATEVASAYPVTEDFLNTTKKTEGINSSITETTISKTKIFIVHGRDDTSALRLQKHLLKKGIEAEMFEDFKEAITGNTTVIEELIRIKDEVAYVFIVATADDLGNFGEKIENHINSLVKGKSTVVAKDVCDILDNLNFRARQNVIFEYGLFLGVLGREKVQCLWNKKIGEKPSDIKGVLNIQFEKNIKETYTELDDKLEKLGLIKK